MIVAKYALSQALLGAVPRLFQLLLMSALDLAGFCSNKFLKYGEQAQRIILCALALDVRTLKCLP